MTVDPTTHYMQATERMRVRAETAEKERDELQAAVLAALDIVRSMTETACDADVVRVADLYRVLAR